MMGPPDRERVLAAFRHWGYLQADLDRLGRLRPAEHPALDLAGSEADRARRLYCGTIGVEFMHMPFAERCRWIQARMEATPRQSASVDVTGLLVRAAVFEEFLQARYVGTKRFSIEGCDALIPLLAELLEAAGECSAQEALIAMTHRGRLNVMYNVLGIPAEEIFAEFEDVDPRSTLGGGDVRYHLGATGEYTMSNGSSIHIHLVSNPSHLEAVTPVALGRARAKQCRLGLEGENAILPILIHGDAAFAGQGIAAESLNLAGLLGYAVGGSIHVIVNNLIGFTTEPRALYSSRFASDLAKRASIPIFHVNGEDPDAVARVARLAVEFRQAFRSDIVIDLIGYRRHGHSEIDDPTVTQPVLYGKIDALPPLWRSYSKQTHCNGAAADAQVQDVRAELQRAKERAEKRSRPPVLRQLPWYWSEYEGGPYRPQHEVATTVPTTKLEQLTERLIAYPEGFNVHPKVRQLLDRRAAMGLGARPVDFGMSELLAFASLVDTGHPVRLSGEDSRRGTFNQRHAVLIDTQTGEEYCPLEHIRGDQARFEAHDSPLSEAALVGYEYGFSRDYPEALVVWEAQFGDFANGAQVILDQFVTAGEDKWGLLSGLVLLLPHGFEGQGPEHSSARIERFLQLAAEDALQVAQPSTAGQYFHLLRRQVLRKWRKPLVILTPKGRLRDRRASSGREVLSGGCFKTVLPDESVNDARKILLCSGKLAHELHDERDRRGDSHTGIVRLEQLCPFPEADLAAELARHPSSHEVVWVQEEPANMGALSYVMPRIRRLANGRGVRSVKRAESASPATGSPGAHRIEQQTLISVTFG